MFHICKLHRKHVFTRSEQNRETIEFWRSWGVMQAVLSQNMILSLPSVWGVKSLKS